VLEQGEAEANAVLAPMLRPKRISELQAELMQLEYRPANCRFPKT
jgi:hypothetical protein